MKEPDDRFWDSITEREEKRKTGTTTASKNGNHQHSRHSTNERNDKTASNGIREVTSKPKTPKVDLFPAPMASEAFDGLAGKLIDVMEPGSECNRENLLMQLLVSLGNLLGHRPFKRQAGSHHLVEFVAVVGDTSEGRKGSGLSMVNDLLYVIDPSWRKCRVNGIQSGQAIVHSVRDPRSQGGKQVDDGVSDKRLFLVETELSRLFTLSKTSAGISISPLLREVWDCPYLLRNAGKHSPDTATDAHINVLGHVTREELKDVMSRVECENGLGNRFLWVAAKRIRKIPIPKWINWKADHLELLRELALVISFADPRRNITIKDDGTVELEIASSLDESVRTAFEFSVPGARLWDEFYDGPLCVRPEGLYGKLISRPEAHVLRLSMLYAVLDRSHEIEEKHVRSAMAVWRYCRDSVKWCFSKTAGDWRADKILSALTRRPEGMTRSEISDEVFQHNTPSEDIGSALQVLIEGERITAESTASRIHGGRPTTTYFLS